MSKQHLELSVNSYFTRGTFYRLSLPNILSDRDKVLFLDTDMVVLKDVTVLYEQELGDALLAAVPDLIMRSFVGLGVAAIGEVGGLRAARYISDRIGLKCSADYFQAGVLLMNLAQMRRTCLSDRMTHALRTERFWFLDQDVLNKFARGQVIYLDFRWNSVYMDQYHLDALDKDDCVSYMKTLDDPWIVHYAGINKPWQQAGHPHATHYWCALRLTRWYEIALFAFLAPGEGKEQVVVRPGGLYRKSISLWIVRKMWRALPQSVRRTLMPIGDAVKKRVALEM